MTTVTSAGSFRPRRLRLWALLVTLGAAPAVLASVGDAVGHATIVPGVLDFGQVAAGTAAHGSLWIINTSGAPMTVVSAKGSCGCTTIVEFESETLEPRQAKELLVRMKASGKHLHQVVSKSVTVTLADGPPVEAQVRIDPVHPLFAKLLGYREARKAHDTERIAGYLADELMAAIVLVL